VPNWVYQDIHVVGSREEIDRFYQTGFVRKKPGTDDDQLDFMRLCPLRPGEPKDTYTHESGVVLEHFRTYTQAMFSIMTSWDYPGEFYRRLPNHWPELAFRCTVTDEVEELGGLLTVMDGVVSDCVQTYTADYDRRAQRGEVSTLVTHWFERLTAGRDWRLTADTGDRKSLPVDAHFDDDFRFYFQTRDELARFKRRYKSAAVMRRDGWLWRPARIA
jgi:hypothetical protein